MIEMELTGVRVELPTNQPIVLLRERGGERYLPDLDRRRRGRRHRAVAPRRASRRGPMTHDLLKTILEDLAVQVQPDRGDRAPREHVLRHDRPGAQRRGARGLVPPLRRDRARRADVGPDLRAARTCSTEASILIPGDEEEEVEKFREFLDNVTPEDFESCRASARAASGVDGRSSVSRRRRR